MRRATVIITAKDEAKRVGTAIAAAHACPLVGRVILVDDGSSDWTAEVGRWTGAEVVRLPKNVGKGRAMREGVKAAKGADVICFLDADLFGLRPDHVADIIAPVLDGHADQCIGICERTAPHEVAATMPLISGQRAIRRSVLDTLPPKAWEGYGIETWLSDAGARSARGNVTVPLDGVADVYKWQKGAGGVAKLADMGASVVRANRDVVRFHRPPNPATLEAECDSTECVTDALARSMMRHGAPFVRDEVLPRVWNAETRAEVAGAIGTSVARYAGPAIWFGTGIVALVVIGPIGAIGTGVLYFLTRGG